MGLLAAAAARAKAASATSVTSVTSPTGAASTAQAAGTAAPAVQRGRVLQFPRDHGAHLAARTEWWYATGWLGTETRPAQGFQITFFRSRTGLAEGNPSRFAARHLLFAHAALTALEPTQQADSPPEKTHTPLHVHDQRITRWTGDPSAPLAHSATDRGDVRIGGWRLTDEGSHWHAVVAARGFALDLRLARTQPLLLQGSAGFSRKGPDASQASHYCSEVQLAAQSGMQSSKQAGTQTGRAWLDHEWSDQILHPNAVGWDWLGMNLFDGSALTAFVLRQRDGAALWAGGSFRRLGQAAQDFSPDQVRLTPGRRWTSGATGTVYPVEWTVDTPAGRHTVRALADAQELDSRGSTGAIYWEGLSELLDGQGRRVGLGYLEMTGYAAPLALR
jgi:predicted secreted hydrolase